MLLIGLSVGKGPTGKMLRALSWPSAARRKPPRLCLFAPHISTCRLFKHRRLPETSTRGSAIAQTVDHLGHAMPTLTKGNPKESHSHLAGSENMEQRENIGQNSGGHNQPPQRRPRWAGQWHFTRFSASRSAPWKAPRRADGARPLPRLHRGTFRAIAVQVLVEATIPRTWPPGARTPFHRPCDRYGPPRRWCVPLPPRGSRRPRR